MYNVSFNTSMLIFLHLYSNNRPQVGGIIIISCSYRPVGGVTTQEEHQLSATIIVKRKNLNIIEFDIKLLKIMKK